MTNEPVLGITVLNRSGRTSVPIKVMAALKLKYTPQRRQKLLWTNDEGNIVVNKGTLQSSFRKTMLSRGGNTAIPKHIREVLELKSAPDEEERLIWIQRGDNIVVRKGTPR